jgi:hypothetical protein
MLGERAVCVSPTAVACSEALVGPLVQTRLDLATFHPRLSKADALPNNARFVESPGPLPAQLALGASLFTFGSEVWRRDYTPR